MEEQIDVREMGPIDYAVFEFPGSRFNGEIAPNIIDLIERGVVTLLDLVFIKKDDSGSLEILEVAGMDQDEIGGLALYHDEAGDLLSEEDIGAAGEIIEPGSSALFMVWENTWAAPLATAVHRSGGVLASTGRIPAQDLLAALGDGS